jgi:hypothetical protein
MGSKYVLNAGDNPLKNPISKSVWIRQGLRNRKYGSRALPTKIARRGGHFKYRCEDSDHFFAGLYALGDARQAGWRT